VTGCWVGVAPNPVLVEPKPVLAPKPVDDPKVFCGEVKGDCAWGWLPKSGVCGDVPNAEPNAGVDA